MYTVNKRCGERVGDALGEQSGVEDGVAEVLRRLYLRRSWGPAVSSRGWREVVRAIRMRPDLEVADALRLAGWREAAAALGGVDPGASGVMTVGSSCYPPRWVERLGVGTPPAVYISESWSAQWGASSGWLAIVGSRSPEEEDCPWIERAIRAAAALGWGIVSGGAFGVDAWAEREARALGVPFVAVLPAADPCREGAWVAVNPSEVGFTVAGAMERNGLIYALSEAAWVVRPRWRTGGTWHGAVDGLRRRWVPVIVPSVSDPIAHRAVRALRALGARDPGGADLTDLLRSGAMPGLFSG